MVGFLQDGVLSGLRRALQGWRLQCRNKVIIAGTVLVLQEWCFLLRAWYLDPRTSSGIFSVW